jgi:polygalacturonase
MHSSLLISMFFAATALAVEPGSTPEPQQLPRAMHTAMKDRAQINVGLHDGDIIGADNRALQAAVDYVASLGGGVVVIGPGEFAMRDSLHLRPQVTVRGTAKQTVLRKAKAAVSRLKVDGDYGEEQFTVENADGFTVGDGVAIWDKGSNGFHTTVARITGRNENTFSISKPLNADCMVSGGAQAATVFPCRQRIRCGWCARRGSDDRRKQGGKRFAERLPWRRHLSVSLRRRRDRTLHGAQLSRRRDQFQQCNDVTVLGCTSEGNAGLGLHPGSGSQRPIVRQCTARNNGEDGLFLCWRVKQGVFEENVLDGQRRYGISIGHKDTDNLLRKNQVRGNHEEGIFFRNETEGMAAHRNRVEDNVIENNGIKKDVAGIRVRGETRDLIFKNNVVRDTRAEPKQSIGIQLEEKVGSVVLDGNKVEAAKALEDKRKEIRAEPLPKGAGAEAPGNR